MSHSVSMSQGNSSLEAACVLGVREVVDRKGFGEDPVVAEAYQRTQEQFFNEGRSELDPFLYFTAEVESALDGKRRELYSSHTECIADVEILRPLQEEREELVRQTAEITGSLLPSIFSTRAAFTELTDIVKGSTENRHLAKLLRNEALFSLRSRTEDANTSFLGRAVDNGIDRGLGWGLGVTGGAVAIFAGVDALYSVRDSIDLSQYTTIWGTISALFSALQVYSMSMNQHKVKDATSAIGDMVNACSQIVWRRPECADAVQEVLVEAKDLMEHPGKGAEVGKHVGLYTRMVTTALGRQNDIQDVEDYRYLRENVTALNNSVLITKVDTFLARTLYYPVQTFLTVAGILSAGYGSVVVPAITAVFNKLNKDAADPRLSNQVDLQPLEQAIESIHGVREYQEMFARCVVAGAIAPTGDTEALALYELIDAQGSDTLFAQTRSVLGRSLSGELTGDGLTAIISNFGTKIEVEQPRYSGFSNSTKELDDTTYHDIEEFYIPVPLSDEPVHLCVQRVTSSSGEKEQRVMYEQNGNVTGYSISGDAYEALLTVFYRNVSVSRALDRGLASTEQLPENWSGYVGEDLPKNVLAKRVYEFRKGDTRVTAEVYMDGTHRSEPIFSVYGTDTVELQLQKTAVDGIELSSAPSIVDAIRRLKAEVVQ
ncbi:MAG: hypothetical protein OXR66_02475 [Candidatus Woesearchaeota archaeon]|nr:hypothetical protein [Candidatus Woesearchaeota archaeon]